MHNIATPFSTHVVEERKTPESLRRMPFRFAASVPAGQTVTLERKVPRDGTVEAVRIRIYAGAELALRIRPYVINERLERRDLIAYAPGGKQFVDGDDDTWTFGLREPIYQNGDTLIVEAENTTPAADGYAYDFAVDIEVDFAGGPWPLLGVTAHG